MPRRTTRSGRQHYRPRRANPPTQRSTETAAATEAAPVAAQPATPARTTTAPAAPARAPRRPASTAASSLSSEQVRNEMRYIRSDLVRMLITTVVVVLFMVLANWFLS